MKNNQGFSLVEVLISIAIMLTFLPYAASMMANSRLLSSYSKHKIQAAYLAEHTLEYERMIPYSGSGSYNNFSNLKSVPTTLVDLDTKGDFNQLNPSSHFMANVTVTVTPAVYTNSLGVKTTNNAVDHVVVNVQWTENILKAKITMNENYATDIIGDPMLN